MAKIHPSRLEAINLRPSIKREVDTSALTRIGRDECVEYYASESLVAELRMIRKLGGLAQNNVYHATSSVALSGIAKHKALLSSQALMQESEAIVTGEITTEVGAVHRRLGLADVYASNSPISRTYANVVGDTDYPIVFGINPNTVEKPPVIRRDWGDGIVLGPRVALESVTTQIVDYHDIPKVQEWSAQNDIEPLIMSHDAATVLTYLGDTIREL